MVLADRTTTGAARGCHRTLPTAALLCRLYALFKLLWNRSAKRSRQSPPSHPRTANSEPGQTRSIRFRKMRGIGEQKKSRKKMRVLFRGALFPKHRAKLRAKPRLCPKRIPPRLRPRRSRSGSLCQPS